MAKFELKTYDMTNGETVKTYQKNIITVVLYCKFQELNENIKAKKVKNDIELFLTCYKDLMLEMFPEMTEREYLENTNPAEVVALWRKVCNTALILGDNEKN